jgi:hypothetical protein
MESRIKYILFFIICAVTNIVYANGGITVHSSVTSTGNPVFKDIPSINIVSEKLNVALDGAYSHVTVDYVLWNNSDTDYMNQDYGFPVDYVVGTWDGPPSMWKDNYISGVEFRTNGEIISHTVSPEAVINKAWNLNGWIQSESYSYNKLYRRWFFTKISLKKYSYLSLQVKYSVMNASVEDGHSPLFLDYLEGGGCTFNYDFSPASQMGDGLVKDFYVSIDASVIFSTLGETTKDFYDSGSSVSETDNISFNGLDFQKQGTVYTYKTRNFDLKKALPLEIGYRYGCDIDFLANNILGKGCYTVATSSEQSKYPLSNLSDMNFETAWVSANKGGIGDWVEFTFKKGYSPSGCTFLNGYQKSEKTYTENNRIKKIRLEAWFPDGKKQVYEDEYDTSLPDRQYQPVFFENMFYKADLIDFFGISDMAGSEGNIQKLRFTILDVYPGTKYNDTCISEIIFYR